MSITWSPTDSAYSGAAIDLSNGGLTATPDAAYIGGGLSRYTVRATVGKSTGKWYFEITQVVYSAYVQNYQGVGTSGADLLHFLGYDAYGWGVTGNYSYNNNTGTTGLPSLANGDVVMIAIDLDAGNLWFGKNGTWDNSGDPATGASPSYTGVSGTMFPMLTVSGNTLDTPSKSEATANFAGPFAYTQPAGFFAYDALSGGVTGVGTLAKAAGTGVLYLPYTHIAGAGTLQMVAGAGGTVSPGAMAGSGVLAAVVGAGVTGVLSSVVGRGLLLPVTGVGTSPQYITGAGKLPQVRGDGGGGAVSRGIMTPVTGHGVLMLRARIAGAGVLTGISQLSGVLPSPAGIAGAGILNTATGAPPGAVYPGVLPVPGVPFFPGADFIVVTGVTGAGVLLGWAYVAGAGVLLPVEQETVAIGNAGGGDHGRLDTLGRFENYVLRFKRR